MNNEVRSAENCNAQNKAPHKQTGTRYPGIVDPKKRK